MLQAPFLEVSVGKSSERILTQCRQVKFPTFRTNFNFCARFDSEKCVQSEDTSTRTINRCNKYSQTVERVSIIRIRIWEELKGRINYQYYEFLLVVWVWMTEGSRKMSAVMYLSMILIAIFIFVADHSDSLEREFIVSICREGNKLGSWQWKLFILPLLMNYYWTSTHERSVNEMKDLCGVKQSKSIDC